MPICSDPKDLKRGAVIKHARKRPADDSDTNDLPIDSCAEAKLMPDYRLMMAVMLLDKRIGFIEWQRDQLKHSASPIVGLGL